MRVGMLPFCMLLVGADLLACSGLDLARAESNRRVLKSSSGSQAWEAETLAKASQHLVNGGKVSVQSMRAFGTGWSGNAQLLWSEGQVGAVLDLLLDVPVTGLYRVQVDFTKAPDYGNVKTEINGRSSGVQFNGYGPQVSRSGAVNFGAFQFQAGQGKISLMLIGKDRQSSGYLVGIDRIVLISNGQ